MVHMPLSSPRGNQPAFCNLLRVSQTERLPHRRNASQIWTVSRLNVVTQELVSRIFLPSFDVGVYAEFMSLSDSEVTNNQNPPGQWAPLRQFVQQAIEYLPETFCGHNELSIYTDVKGHVASTRFLSDILAAYTRSSEWATRLPSHAESMPLLRRYTTTWESRYRVLHLPSFWKEYYDTIVGITRPRLSFRILMLLILLLGQRASSPATRADFVASPVYDMKGWEDETESYVALLAQNQHLSLEELQILCLFTMYQVSTLPPSGARVHVQTLVRCAIQSQLHRDPCHMKELSVLDKELRRRLWATTQEIDIQASLDAEEVPFSATVPVNVHLPANINDIDLHPLSTEIRDPEPTSAGTDSSFQRSLFRHAAIRIQACQIMFNVQSSPVAVMAIMHTIERLWNTHPSFNNSGPILAHLHLRRCLLALRLAQVLHSRDIRASEHRVSQFQYELSLFLKAMNSLPSRDWAGSLISSSLVNPVISLVYLSCDIFSLSPVHLGDPNCALSIKPQDYLSHAISPSRLLPEIIEYLCAIPQAELRSVCAMSDKEYREYLILLFISLFIGCKPSAESLPRSQVALASILYGKICLLMIANQNTSPVYQEISNMAGFTTLGQLSSFGDF